MKILFKKQLVLIDDLIHQKNNQKQFQIKARYINLCGWRIAKPFISNSLFTRIFNAFRVLAGKAYVYSYFEDLSEKQKIKHVENELKRQIETSKTLKHGKISN